MAFEYLGANILDYSFCNYGDSRRLFRGPAPELVGDFDVAVGGSETFGKFIEQPFPSLLAGMTGRSVVNLGQMYAGADFFSSDGYLMDICKKSKNIIVQVTGAQNMSNRFYSVHPRRNDRFLFPTKLLAAIYGDLEFTDIHFTGHLLNKLHSHCPKRFDSIVSGLREDWVAQMTKFLSNLTGQVALLWVANHAPEQADFSEFKSSEPMLITRGMLDQITKPGIHSVEVVAMPEEIAAGFERMVFNPIEEPAAEQMLGPIVHQEVARQLGTIIS